ncbi:MULTISPECIES: LysM peptidoglycan-binding domain-containing protein [unclassified Fredinandcohnia]|uniref:LysM peptidoglycan-binding domain-containing protein n=1 Tax=unclassified Fredinandcohnia TaxID=2837514 RepID=UPI0030FD7FD9
MKHPEGEETSVNKRRRTSTLPSRSEIHNKKKKKTKFKIKYPIIRLLALLFILLPIAILSYKFNTNPEKLEASPLKKSANFESISYEDKEDAFRNPENDEEETPTEEIETEQEPAEQEQKTVEPNEAKQSEVNNQEETKEEAVQKVEANKSNTDEVKQPVQEQPKDRYNVKYHTVKADETLFRISMKYYNSRSGEELIKRWNNLNGETVIEGQVLEIPIKINE